MTKEEILAAAGFPNTPEGIAAFYDTYGSREEWEQAQQQMAYGGMPNIMGTPFGAGITMAYGGNLFEAGEGIEKSAAAIAGEKSKWASGYGSIYGKDAFRRTSQAQLLKEHPGLSYVSGDYRKGQGLFEHTDPETQKKTQYYLTQEPHGNYMFFDASLAKTPPAQPVQKVQPTKPIQATIQSPVPDVQRKEVARTSDYVTYQYPHPSAGYSQAETKYVDAKTGLPIADISKAYNAEGKYIAPQPIAAVANNNPPLIQAYGGTTYFGGPLYPAALGGAPCYDCGGPHMEAGGDVRNKPGGSNVGKKTFADGSKRTGPYVGPSGGAPAGSYPVPDIKHARAALALAHNAPNPEGIKNKVKQMYPSLNKAFGGSMTPDLEGQYPIFGYGGYDSPFNYGQFPAMRTGGNKTSQGGNQKHIDELNSSYMAFIRNNVIKNMHQEESQKVQDAFMQMHGPIMMNGGNYMQGGGAYDTIDPTNAALQNMYANNINQFQNQFAQDRSNLRQANRNLFNQFSQHDLPEAKEGDAGQPNQSQLIHQFAEEFGPQSRRTGLPLFPANVSSKMQLTKKSAKTLQDVPEGFKMEGFEMEPKWGLLARTKMGKYMGLGPKSIKYKFSGTRGYLPGEPRPDTHETLPQPMTGPPTAYDQANPYGPIPAGTTQAPIPFMPASIKPGYNASGERVMPNGVKEKDFFKQPYFPGEFNWNYDLSQGRASDMLNPAYNPKLSGEKPSIGKTERTWPMEEAKKEWRNLPEGFEQDAAMNAYRKNYRRNAPYGETSKYSSASYIKDPMAPYNAKLQFMQSQLQGRAYGGDYFYNGGPYEEYPTINPGLGSPIDLKGTPTYQTTFSGQPAATDYSKMAGANKNVMMADQSKNTPYVQGPQVMYDPSKDRSKEKLEYEGKMKRSWEGIGDAIGQYGAPLINRIAAWGEAKDLAEANKQLAYGTTAEKTFRASPLNAKNRGKYDPNSGVLEPDKYVVRFGGFNTMQEGGDFEEGEELDLSPEEIANLREQGYDIEFLD